MPIINDPDGLSQGGITTVTAAAITASGADITITDTEVPAVTVGDYIEIRDAADAVNNGLYLVTVYTASTLITATKQALTGAVVNPTPNGSDTIRIFGSNTDEKNIHFDTTNKKITFLNGFGSTTILDNAGVVGQALYSFCKEEWASDNDLIKFPFPMTAITSEQFEFNDWQPVDQAESTIDTDLSPKISANSGASNTRSLIRTAGWDEVDADGDIVEQYFGWVTLGNIDAGDNAYYFFDSQTSATFATFDGAVNEAVESIKGIDTTSHGTLAFGTSTTFTNTTGDFVADGFLVGDNILFQSAEDSANNVSATITTVATNTITCSGASFTINADDTTVKIAIDRRSAVFTARIRIFGKTYDQSTSTAIGVTNLTNQVYRFPLSEASDAVVSDLVTTTVSDLLNDITVPTIASPYNDMAIGYFAAAEERTGFNGLADDSPINSGDAFFGVIIEADAGGQAGGPPTAEQIYAFTQATLQETTNINDPDGRITGEDTGVTIVGLLAEPLTAMASTGNTLFTIGQTTNPAGGGTGVAVDNFDSNDTNRVSFVDNDGDTRTFPFVASGTITFNSNLSTDTNAVYRMFFTNDDTGDNSGRDFGTIDAITVQDNAGPTDIAGSVPQQAGSSSVAFDFDYDGNVQRGTGSDATDAPITIVAIGLSTGQYVLATGTIGRAVNQSFSLVSALERNFANN